MTWTVENEINVTRKDVKFCERRLKWEQDKEIDMTPRHRFDSKESVARQIRARQAAKTKRVNKARAELQVEQSKLRHLETLNPKDAYRPHDIHYEHERYFTASSTFLGRETEQLFKVWPSGIHKDWVRVKEMREDGSGEILDIPLPELLEALKEMQEAISHAS